MKGKEKRHKVTRSMRINKKNIFIYGVPTSCLELISISKYYRKLVRYIVAADVWYLESVSRYTKLL